MSQHVLSAYHACDVPPKSLISECQNHVSTPALVNFKVYLPPRQIASPVIQKRMLRILIYTLVFPQTCTSINQLNYIILI